MNIFELAFAVEEMSNLISQNLLTTLKEQENQNLPRKSWIEFSLYLHRIERFLREMFSLQHEVIKSADSRKTNSANS